MYNDFFSFNQTPFSIAPDPGFLYLSDRHREALAHLMYGMRSEGGFVLITGEVGTGKTTLIRSVIEQVPADLQIGFILNPRLTVKELLETLCDELGVDYPRDRTLSIKHYIDHLNRHLLESHAQGRSTVLMIDEAQNLPPPVLEQIRLLTNLETTHHKLLRIILVGQPELDNMLERPELRQLGQRITARCHLTALDPAETRAYVAHRLTLAGSRLRVFTAPALRELYRRSAGVPRLINTIADRALLGAYVEGRPRVTRRILKSAAQELGCGQPRGRKGWLAAAAALALTIGGAGWALQQLEAPWLPPTVAALLDREAARGAAQDEPQPEASSERDAAAADAAVEREEATEPDEGEQRYRIIGPDAQIRFTEHWPEAAPGGTEEPGGNGEDEAGGRIIRPQSEASAPAVARPSGLGVYETQAHAYRALFRAWGRRFSDSDIPCNVAPEVGLQCLKGSGGWQELARLNRPAVLELTDAEGGRYFAALLRHDEAEGEAEVTLRVGERDLRVPFAALLERWPGDYVVLWEMPPRYRGSVRPGEEQPVVPWLRRKLSQLLDREIAAERPTRMDDTLEEAVRAFQRHNGLAADGIAGPATWIHLNSRIAEVPMLDEDGPRLSQPDERVTLQEPQRLLDGSRLHE